MLPIGRRAYHWWSNRTDRTGFAGIPYILHVWHGSFYGTRKTLFRWMILSPSHKRMCVCVWFDRLTEKIQLFALHSDLLTCFRRLISFLISWISRGAFSRIIRCFSRHPSLTPCSLLYRSLALSIHRVQLHSRVVLRRCPSLYATH